MKTVLSMMKGPIAVKMSADGNTIQFSTITRKKPRKKPEVGDVKVVKGVKYIRHREYVNYFGKYSSVVRHGRPGYVWIKEGEVYPPPLDEYGRAKR
jgi:hypothetical protein